MGAMNLDFDRLAHAAREARRARAWRQEDVADRAHVGLSSVQNMEKGRPFNRFPSTYRKIESTLGWAEGSIMAILRGGEPTVAEPSTTPATTAREADQAVQIPSDVPLPVQALLRFGTLVGGDVFTVNMDGEEVKIGVFATSKSAIDKLVSQYERLGEVTGQVKRTLESGQDESTPDSAGGAEEG